MFEIVKRKYIRQARHLVLANQRRPRRPSAPDVFGKQMSSERSEDRSFLYRVCPLAEGADIDHESNQVS